MTIIILFWFSSRIWLSYCCTTKTMMTTMYDGHGIYYHTPGFSNYRV
ncbi:hypothetical protein HMPREF9997_01261 [Corynebacterium durum F0235]|uniref:Uncharacterized protein n=1 Tax=Corynebacterium durum F0235 TaxID=1035195 RepID=L1MFM1_9CORY|nr:hypothetical protein HMPREF9997_01261 [Corynebacterium durum F0235]